MAHEVAARPQPNIAVLRLTGDLTFDDMVCDDEIGLNDGEPLYLLLDASQMHVALPDNFLDGAKRSFFTNDNLIHMALVLESQMLRVVANMVAKVTRRQDKMSLHSTYNDALRYLQALDARTAKN